MIGVVNPKDKRDILRKWLVCIYLNIYLLTCFVRDRNWGRDFGFLVMCRESWSEFALRLSCCLHSLLTIVSLAANLVHQDCVISGRMAKVHSLSTKTVWSIWGLFSFWSGTPSCQSSSQDYWSRLVLDFFHWIGCFLDSCLPSCFRLTWLMQCLFLKSLLELFLKHFLSVFCEWPDKSHGSCAFSMSYRKETVRVTNTETIGHFWTQLKRQPNINYFWHVLFNTLFPRNYVNPDFSK